MIYKIAEFSVREEKIDEARTAISEFVANVHKNEPKTLRYESFNKKRCDFIHFMQFEDTQAEQNHTQTPHVKKFVSVLYPLCINEPIFTDLTIVE